MSASKLQRQLANQAWLKACAKENGWWSPQKVWWNPDPTNYPVGWCDDDPGHDNDGRVWAIRVVDADSPMVRQTEATTGRVE